jgi:WhiB family redox-sensing transcriptional regulator
MSPKHELAGLIEPIPSPDWIDRAACGDLDVEQLEMFFVEAGRVLSKEAAALCSRCPVRLNCVGHAIDHELAGGYFGGMSPSRRRALAAERVATTADAPIE